MSHDDILALLRKRCGTEGVTASEYRDNRRVIVVLAGLSSMKARAQESERLIEWAFREFGGYALYKPGDTVDDAEVWLGADARVPLTAASDAVVTIPRRTRKDMKVMAVYDKPIKAPVAMGQTVGKLVVTVPGQTPTEFPLVAANGVERLGAMGRVGAALSYMVFGSKR